MSGGVLRRAGHTEAAVDLARLAGCYPAGVICEVLDEDGGMARVPQLQELALEHGLTMITIKDLIEYRIRTEKLVRRIATHKLRSEEHTSELQSPCNLVCRLLLEKKKKNIQ